MDATRELGSRNAVRNYGIRTTWRRDGAVIHTLAYCHARSSRRQATPDIGSICCEKSGLGPTRLTTTWTAIRRARLGISHLALGDVTDAHISWTPLTLDQRSRDGGMCRSSATQRD